MTSVSHAVGIDMLKGNLMRKNLKQAWMPTCVLIASLAALTGCGGSGGGSGSSGGNGDTGNGGASTFSIGGTITGLGPATGLELVNGGDSLKVPTNATTFTMPTSVANGQAYNVTVKVHPAALDCSVTSGAGTVNGANVTGITVSCTAGAESLLYSFVGGTTDGANPQAGLVMDSAGNLYGTTFGGGTDSYGTVFEISASGTETVLYSFAGGTTDGGDPEAGLIMDGTGNLYGTTYTYGAHGVGAIFEIN